MIKNRNLLAAVAAAHRDGGMLSPQRMSFYDLATLHVWRGSGYVSFVSLSPGVAAATGATYQITALSRAAAVDAERAGGSNSPVTVQALERVA